MPRKDNFSAQPSHAVLALRRQFVEELESNLPTTTAVGLELYCLVHFYKFVVVSYRSVVKFFQSCPLDGLDQRDCPADLSTCEFITCAAPGADSRAMKREGLTEQVKVGEAGTHRTRQNHVVSTGDLWANLCAGSSASVAAIISMERRSSRHPPQFTSSQPRKRSRGNWPHASMGLGRLLLLFILCSSQATV